MTRRSIVGKRGMQLTSHSALQVDTLWHQLQQGLPLPGRAAASAGASTSDMQPSVPTKSKLGWGALCRPAPKAAPQEDRNRVSHPFIRCHSLAQVSAAQSSDTPAFYADPRLGCRTGCCSWASRAKFRALQSPHQLQAVSTKSPARQQAPLVMKSNRLPASRGLMDRSACDCL